MSRPAREAGAVTDLRVLANLCSVVPAQVGGAEPYATRLLAAVASQIPDQAPAVELELASMAGVRAAHPELASPPWHEASWRPDSRVRRAVVESTWLARLSTGFDIVHHFGGRLPARRFGVSVLTVHDIQPLDLPANFSAMKRRYLGWAVPRSVRSADLVTVPSQWVADRLSERLSVPAGRIRVVPPTYARPRSSTGATGSVAEPSGSPVKQPFVLYPAATYPHKNHATLLVAHAAVRARHPDVQLELTGARGRAHAQVAEQAARTPGVVHLGWVDDARLASLMSGASAVAFPSRYEGFGLPVLEAMHSGTPVIAADTTALPEVVGECGTLVDPDDVDGWVDALSETQSGSSRIREQVDLGLSRAADFAPEQAAGRLLEAWRDAAGQAVEPAL